MVIEPTQMVLVQPEPQRNPPALTPMQLIQVATEKGADVATLERLMELQLRWEANEARKAFICAKMAFYAEAPDIVKNKHVGFTSKRTGGDTDYWHATLDSIVKVTAPVLAKHGLTHHWKTATKENPTRVEVTCVLTHELGHSESVSLEGPPETSGTKNPVQAIASTITLLERYTFMAVTGLAAKDQDDDGSRAGADFVTTEQADELQELAESVGADKLKFFAYIGVESFATIPAKKFTTAKSALMKKAGR